MAELLGWFDVDVGKRESLLDKLFSLINMGTGVEEREVDTAGWVV